MMPYIWLGIIVIAVLLEMGTTQLVSIWFAAGARRRADCLSFGCAAFGSDPRFCPDYGHHARIHASVCQKRAELSKKRIRMQTVILGKIAVVTVEINNTLGTGQVNVLGSIWTARSADGSVIPVGQRALVESIDGVKLIVRIKND